MSANSYALNSNKQAVVELSWLGLVYDGGKITVTVDGKEAGCILNVEALAEGQEFMLPNGSRLEIKPDDVEGLQVFENGSLLECLNESQEALSWTVNRYSRRKVSQNQHDIDKLRTAYRAQYPEPKKISLAEKSYRATYKVIIAIGCICISFSLLLLCLGYFGIFKSIKNYPSLFIDLALGLVMLTFGVLVKRKMFIPLLMAILVYAVGSIGIILYVIKDFSIFRNSYIVSAILGIALRMVFLVTMIRGIKAVKELDKPAYENSENTLKG